MPKLQNMTYNEYLKSPQWRDRKGKCYAWSKVCKICGEHKNLHVHHKIYRNFGNEDIADLVILCEHHHREFHRLYGVKENMTKETNLFIGDCGLSKSNLARLITVVPPQNRSVGNKKQCKPSSKRTLDFFTLL